MTTKLIHAFYNMDTNAVELTYNDSFINHQTIGNDGNVGAVPQN